MTDAEAAIVYDCVQGYMKAAYSVADDPAGAQFLDWSNFSLVPYISGTHGNRYVMNYGNDAASAYGEYEEAGTLPAGAKLAKNSFVVSPTGQVSVGPLFLMEKMDAGFSEASGDWKYTMVMPDGSTFGVTAGSQRRQRSSSASAATRSSAEDQDSLYFLPEEYRLTKN